MLNLIRGYAPQSSGSLEEKQCFYDELKGEWKMHCADNLVMYLGDFDVHIHRHVDGLDVVHGGNSVGQEFGRRSVARILSGKRIMHVKYMV